MIWHLIKIPFLEDYCVIFGITGSFIGRIFGLSDLENVLGVSVIFGESLENEKRKKYINMSNSWWWEKVNLKMWRKDGDMKEKEKKGDEKMMTTRRGHEEIKET